MWHAAANCLYNRGMVEPVQDTIVEYPRRSSCLGWRPTGSPPVSAEDWRWIFYQRRSSLYSIFLSSFFVVIWMFIFGSQLLAFTWAISIGILFNIAMSTMIFLSDRRMVSLFPNSARSLKWMLLLGSIAYFPLMPIYFWIRWKVFTDILKMHGSVSQWPKSPTEELNTFLASLPPGEGSG